MEGEAMSRRGNNEGSIYRRADGRWAATVQLGWEEGKRRRKTFYGKTRRDVQEQLTIALRDLQRGLPISTERQTLGQFLAYWLVESVRPTVRPRTFQSYEELVRLHIKPSLGHIALVKLAPREVQSFIKRKLASGLSARRVQYMHAVLRRALGQAEAWGLVPRNVAKLVKPPRVHGTDIQPFTPQEARSFLASIRGDRLEALYTVALAVGLRKGEALGLRWDDVDLETGTLSIRFSLQRIDGKLQLVEPKSAKSRRTIALPALSVSALRLHRARQLEERLAAGSAWQDTGFVFTTPIGTPLDGPNVSRYYHRTLKRIGMPEQRFHDLRHTAASLMLAQGIHPRVVMETLGHSQISLTMNLYSHVIPALQQDAAQRMDALLAGS
jgi:integrase